MHYNNRKLYTINNGNKVEFSFTYLVKAIDRFNSINQVINDFDFDLYSLLGLRNLSALIGEIYVISLEQSSNGFFKKNPHQDGYPDLLSMHSEGKTLWESLKNEMNTKKPFSPYQTGGVEVKSTCGSVPTPIICSKRNLHRPAIFDERINVLQGYDWKAHHRETNNLIGIVWDFINKLPTIVAIFYSHELNEEDWGKVVQPREGGGRTTSVSIMNNQGRLKMYKGWVAVSKETKYRDFFDKKNKDQLLGNIS